VGADVESWDGESAETLREREHLLAFRYGAAERRRRSLDGDHLASDDLAEVERWVAIYSELAEFTHGALEAAVPGAPPVVAGSVPDDPLAGLKLLILQARLQELHLSYWTSRLERLRTESGPGRNPATHP
jgi:hypothetical protein